MKKVYVKDMKYGDEVSSNFMIMKILNKDNDKIVAYIGDNTGDIKSIIPKGEYVLNTGDVIEASGSVTNIFEVKELKKVKNFLIEDYLPTVDRPIEEIMKEIEDISNEEFKSKECIELNNYFFKNKDFINKFKKGIGGVSQHHNYLGGLAEHTLNVMYLAKVMAYRYGCQKKEIAILGAKLHDIGKTEELYTDGPFSYTLRGEMEGHIVIGVEMLDEAFMANPEAYSNEFKARMKGCITQHHGKLEYGSPKKPNMEASYIVHYADYIDAGLNKIGQIKEGLEDNSWSDYNRKIEGKLYI